MWRSETIMLDAERSLHFVQAGEGPDLVLIHGALTTHHDWLAGPADRLFADHRVTIVDRPGHGLSRRPRFFGTPRDQAKQIADGLAAAGVEQAVFVGHSFGCLVALALAEQRPAMVAGLVLVAPLAFPEPRLLEHGLLAPRSTPLLGPLLSRISAGLGVDRSVLDFVQVRMFEPGEIPTRWKESFPFGEVLDPDALVLEGEDAAAVLPMAPAGLIDLSRVRTQVDIVTGEEDRIVANPRQGKRLAGLLHDARLTGIEGAGHMLHHSHSQRIAQIIAGQSPAPAA
jgi:pimeloyl-ACP methyl ester carboxylesterase